MKTTTRLPDAEQVREFVRERYGAIAEQADDSGGCCGSTRATSCVCGSKDDRTYGEKLGYTAEQLATAPAGADLGLGCGNPIAIASIKPGETVLDLGSGAGFDSFLAARQLAGTGRVIGVDMTAAMIAKARANAKKGGYANPVLPGRTAIEFRLGEIEALPVADASVDLIISNCVINLSPEKPRVLREAYRVLKPGGRLAIADIVATKPLPAALRAKLDAISACVAGATPIDQLRVELRDAGFVRIEIEPRETSREYVRHWTDAPEASEFVVSAIVTAAKPE
ncbi:MAG TPA: arsenite methyltransferase [Opitutus sp.]|nr:arsenite methyltransferase [Opitutus sp.]